MPIVYLLIYKSLTFHLSLYLYSDNFLSSVYFLIFLQIIEFFVYSLTYINSVPPFLQAFLFAGYSIISSLLTAYRLFLVFIFFFWRLFRLFFSFISKFLTNHLYHPVETFISLSIRHAPRPFYFPPRLTVSPRPSPLIHVNEGVSSYV